VQWTGSGGFAAKGGDVIVNLGGLPNPDEAFRLGVHTGFFSNAAHAGDDSSAASVRAHADAPGCNGSTRSTSVRSSGRFS